MASGDWVDVAASTAVQDGVAIEVIVNQKVIAIFRQDGDLFALDGMCAHQGGPLAEGNFDHGCVTCPWHGWQYELATGIETVNRKPLQQTFNVREQNGRIEIQDDPANAPPSMH